MSVTQNRKRAIGERLMYWVTTTARESNYIQHLEVINMIQEIPSCIFDAFDDVVLITSDEWYEVDFYLNGKVVAWIYTTGINSGSVNLRTNSEIIRGIGSEELRHKIAALLVEDL